MSLNQTVLCATKLTNKRIVRVSGEHCYSYLQTLLTNDLRHLLTYRDEAPACMYSFMMNGMGRSLADVFVYKTRRININQDYGKLALAPYHSDKYGEAGNAEDELLIECQSSLAKPFARALLAHKVKRCITTEIATEMDIWSLRPKYVESSIPHLNQIRSDDYTLSRDPRLPFLGYRLVTSLGAKTFDQLSRLLPNNIDVEQSTLSEYEKFRYRLGIGEGDKDLPGHFAIPLEANGDLLNGISFKKGLYCGNDITSRNYRKGLQKRLVPIEFSVPRNGRLPEIWPDTELLSLEDGKPMGHLKALRGSVGIGYIDMRFLKRSKQSSVTLFHPQSGLDVTVKIPGWWKKVMPKIPDGRVDAQVLHVTGDVRGNQLELQ
ncbi:putative transferase CAF17 -like protein, mitochondrial [Halotydeus destructor]|nr:putative transferase CAF17 -like protein, mitochondrial [Halotydeus destructor]